MSSYKGSHEIVHRSSIINFLKETKKKKDHVQITYKVCRNQEMRSIDRNMKAREMVVQYRL